MLTHSHYGAAVLFGAKFAIAFPFNFHLFNGVRHLVSVLHFKALFVYLRRVDQSK